MKFSFRATVVAALLVGPAAAAGCGGDEPDGQAAPSRAPSTQVTPPTPSDTPTVALQSWRDNFTADQLTAYDNALARYTDYENRSEPVWKAGKVSDAAVQLFQQYFPSPAWQQVRDRLATYESAQVTMTGLPTVLDSRARTVTTAGDEGSVTIVQCVDYTTVTTTQYGKPVARDAAFTRPVRRTVVLKKSSGSDWLIYDARRPTVDDYQRCSGGGGNS